jgi:hypothetical protein
MSSCKVTLLATLSDVILIGVDVLFPRAIPLAATFSAITAPTFVARQAVSLVYVGNACSRSISAGNLSSIRR